jgi:transcriptional regulator with XRE-family HTH domain
LGLNKLVVGSVLDHYIKASKLTRNEIGNKLKLSQSTITQTVKGRTSVTVERLLEFLAILKITPTQFFNKVEKFEFKVERKIHIK